MRRLLYKNSEGAVAVEFALWVVLLFFVIASGLDFGLYFLQRSKVDEALSATAVGAFDKRENVNFSQLVEYTRAISGDPALKVTLSCNGEEGACTNLSRTCACLTHDGSYAGQACASTCAGTKTTAGYYLTVRAEGSFQPLIVPRSMVGAIDQETTLRLQ